MQPPKIEENEENWSLKDKKVIVNVNTTGTSDEIQTTIRYANGFYESFKGRLYGLYSEKHILDLRDKLMKDIQPSKKLKKKINQRFGIMK